MQFEAAEEHLRAAVWSGAELAIRATAASDFGRCAIVSDGRGAEAAADALAALASELLPVDRERSLELSSALVMVTTVVPRLRHGLATRLERLVAQARGHPPYEAVARIYVARAGLAAGGSAEAAVEEVEAALAAGLPPAVAPVAALAAGDTLRSAEAYGPALRLLEGLLEARTERPCGATGSHSRASRGDRARAGSLCTMRRWRRRPGFS